MQPYKSDKKRVTSSFFAPPPPFVYVVGVLTLITMGGLLINNRIDPPIPPEKEKYMVRSITNIADKDRDGVFTNVELSEALRKMGYKDTRRDYPYILAVGNDSKNIEICEGGCWDHVKPFDVIIIPEKTAEKYLRAHGISVPEKW